MLPNTYGTSTGVTQHPNALRSHSADGLRTPRLLSRWPAISLLLVLLGTALFGVLAINVQTHGPLMQPDTQIVDNLHAFALQNPPFVQTLLSLGFYLGQHVVLAIGVVLAFYFLYKRFWTELCMVIFAWLGEGGIWLILAEHFNRARPHFAESITTPVLGPGFPSGHTMGAVVCYGFLAYLLVPKMPSRFWKAMIILAALFITLYIGFSRVYVGDHYPTDVLAGYALGVAWSALIYTAVEMVSSRGWAKRRDRLTTPHS